jgi:hypothetical protein
LQNEASMPNHFLSQQCINPSIDHFRQLCKRIGGIVIRQTDCILSTNALLRRSDLQTVLEW